MRIETASGHVILADDADAALLNQYGWYVVKAGDGRLYAQAREPGTGKRVKMHRLLMAPPKGKVVHHINNNGIDNQRANLEVTTTRQNIRYHFEGKETGAHFHKQTGKWRSQRRDPEGRRVSLGLHPTREEAMAAAAAYAECQR